MDFKKQLPLLILGLFLNFELCASCREKSRLGILTELITLKGVNRVLGMRLCVIWSKHNAQNSAATNLGISRERVMQAA